MNTEQQWVPTHTRSLSTGQLAAVVNALLEHLQLRVQHRIEDGVLVFRLVDIPRMDVGLSPAMSDAIKRAFLEGEKE